MSRLDELCPHPTAMTVLPTEASSEQPQPKLSSAVSGRWVWTAVMAYIASVTLLGHLGYIGYFWKWPVVLGLLLITVVFRRTALFVHDWLPFLSLVLLFDALRGFIAVLVHHGGRGVFVSYPMAADGALTGIEMIPAALQRAFYDGTPGLLDRALVLVHASHYVAFLGFLFVVWLFKRDEFPRASLGFLFVMYWGLAFFVVIPTAPPWLASQMDPTLPPVSHITAKIYSVAIPRLQAVFDTNAVAAMPSLHAAFPVFAALTSSRLFGRRAVGMWFYAVAACCAIVYLGEHYVIDVLGGALVAAGSYRAVYLTNLRVAELPAGPTWRSRRLGLAAVVFIVAEAVGTTVMFVRHGAGL